MLTWCSCRRDPMVVSDSPRSLRWAAQSAGVMSPCESTHTHTHTHTHRQKEQLKWLVDWWYMCWYSNLFATSNIQCPWHCDNVTIQSRHRANNSKYSFRFWFTWTKISLSFFRSLWQRHKMASHDYSKESVKLGVHWVISPFRQLVPPFSENYNKIYEE